MNAYVGIDVAFAKKKRLPICIFKAGESVIEPLLLKFGFDKPPVGSGNRALLDLETRKRFCDELLEWLAVVERKHSLQIAKIAIDAPSDYCRPGLTRRMCEKALDAAGISCFATPTKVEFEKKIKKSQEHLEAGGEEAKMPNANQLWMLIGFDIFAALSGAGYSCIETYPQAIVKALDCTEGHKSTSLGMKEQLERAAGFLGIAASSLPGLLRTIGFGSQHDQLDALLSAWIASLPIEQVSIYGEAPDDAIHIPNVPAIRRSNSEALPCP